MRKHTQRWKATAVINRDRTPKTVTVRASTSKKARIIAANRMYAEGAVMVNDLEVKPVE